MIKLIPISEIDSGIKTCVNKSEMLLEAAKKLYDCQYVNECVIMYYYAVEEFGKAVLLKERKKVVISQNKSDADVSDFFYKHDEKINAARNVAGNDIDIMEYNAITEDGQFHPLIEKGPIIKGYKERSSVFLTDYDPSTKEWGKIVPIPIAYQIEKAFEKLQNTLNSWK